VTFIILERSKEPSVARGTIPADLSEGMIGDVNLFLTDASDEEDDQAIEQTNSGKVLRKQGELEIMIAEQSARRKGYASQALTLMICYAMQHLHLGPEDFLVRIGMNNTKSIHMFERMGFEIVKRVDVFQEVEMRVRTRVEQFKWLMQSEKVLETRLLT
jgi:RimJ/RimL family protein N-acetyltransferase